MLIFLYVYSHCHGHLLSLLQVQHGAEKAKDTVDIGSHDVTSKASRTGSHVSKDVKHAGDNVKEKVEDVMAAGDRKTHEAGVKGKRAVQHAGEKVCGKTLSTL